MRIVRLPLPGRVCLGARETYDAADEDALWQPYSAMLRRTAQAAISARGGTRGRFAYNPVWPPVAGDRKRAAKYAERTLR